MAVVDVRDMRVIVLERTVRVLMRVRLPGRIVSEVCVLVVLIVRMTVVVRHGHVGVRMTVALAHKQGDTQQHQEHGRRFAQSEVLPEDRDADQDPEERGRGEEGRLTGYTDQPHRVHREDDAQSVTDKAKQ